MWPHAGAGVYACVGACVLAPPPLLVVVLLVLLVLLLLTQNIHGAMDA